MRSLQRLLLLVATISVQTAFAKTTIQSLLQKFGDEIINPLIAIVAALALLVFLWGVVEFIAKAGNEEARTTGKKHIIWGLIGLAIIFGVAGIINILESFFEPDLFP